MAGFMHLMESVSFRKNSRLYLAFSWCLGLIFGGLVFRNGDDTIVSFVSLAASGELSLMGLLLSASFPFLAAAFAVFSSTPKLLLVVSFFSSFTYAYVLCAVFAAFDYGGWLIRWLLLFTDTLRCTLLYGYMQRHISGLRGFSLREPVLCVVALGFVVFLDFSFISPFLRQLLL